MQMTDFSFLLYFLPLMLLGYFILSYSRKAQNLWLVLSSLIFYSFGNYIYLIFLAVITIANYYLGYAVYKYQKKPNKVKKILQLTWVLNLFPLFFYVHLPSMLETLLGFVNVSVPQFPAAPLGVAFLALHGISYVTDIYRRKVEWNPCFADTALYFTFFPPLQAGPVIRYHDVAMQFSNRKVQLDKFAEGVCRFVVGLARIVLLAQPLFVISNIVFSQSNISGVYTTVPVLLAFLGLVAYALAMYHYLSGFSDLVIGLGRTLGFVYPENFDNPLKSVSLTTFLQRFYISLYTWFVEYVYQSLNKQRTNNDHMVLHMLIMWLFIGLWLGAGINKIIFALWVFFFLLLEKIIEFDSAKNKSPLRTLYVVFVVLIATVAIKTQSIYEFTLFISNLFGMKNNGFYSEFAQLLVQENWLPLIAGLVCLFPFGDKMRVHAEEKGSLPINILYVFYPVVMILLIVLVMMQISSNSYDPSQLINFRLWS